MREINVFHFEKLEELLSSCFGRNRTKGQLKALADHIGIHPSRITRMLNGAQPPTLEQTHAIAEFLNLDTRETEYLMALGELARTDRPKYKTYIREKIAKLKASPQGPAEMTVFDGKLTKRQASLFYSSHIFQLVWLASTVEAENSLEEIAKKFELPIFTVEQTADFLCNVGICRMERGRLIALTRIIETTERSPHVEKNLSNWRHLAIQRLSDPAETDLFFSEPVAIGRKAYAEIRAILKIAIQNSQRILATEPSEVVGCLNIDLFQLERLK